MANKFHLKYILAFLLILTTAGCGGLRFSQAAPEAKDFHPKKIAVFPMEVWNHKEADSRVVVEQIVSSTLIEKKWFTRVVDAENLQREFQANEELRKAKDEYFSKLRMLTFSDPDLSRKMGQLADIDAFVLVSIDEWKYTAEGDNKKAQVAMTLEVYDTATGKLMWKAGDAVVSEFILIRPELPKVAQDVARKMIAYMPH